MSDHLLYVVDDDAVILQVIGRVAQECGYRVRTFATGPAFETALAEQEPDLIGGMSRPMLQMGGRC